MYFCVLAALKLLVGPSQHVFLHFCYETVIVVKLVEISIRLLKNSFHHQKAREILYVRHYYDYPSFSNSCGVMSVWKRIFELVARKFAPFLPYFHILIKVEITQQLIEKPRQPQQCLTCSFLWTFWWCKLFLQQTKMKLWNQFGWRSRISWLGNFGEKTQTE